MGILLQEMVLDLPRVIDANAVGELYLFERFAIDSMLSISVPGSRNLVLIKDAEFHLPISSAPAPLAILLPSKPWRGNKTCWSC